VTSGVRSHSVQLAVNTHPFLTRRRLSGHTEVRDSSFSVLSSRLLWVKLLRLAIFLLAKRKGQHLLYGLHGRRKTLSRNFCHRWRRHRDDNVYFRTLESSPFAFPSIY